MTRIAVDPARTLGELDRNVFGGFVENLGRCIYGGIYEEGSPLADERGFRKDVLGLLRKLRMGVLRWPGGNFVSNYHWADGIGPKDARPQRPELAWGGEESNRFGTDDYWTDVLQPHQAERAIRCTQASRPTRAGSASFWAARSCRFPLPR